MFCEILYKSITNECGLGKKILALSIFVSVKLHTNYQKTPFPLHWQRGKVIKPCTPLHF